MDMGVELVLGHGLAAVRACGRWAIHVVLTQLVLHTQKDYIS